MRRPPRLVARTLGVTFITVAVILTVVFTVLLVDARDRVRASEVEKLRVGERIFNRFEAQRQRDQQAAIGALAESPSIKAALDTYVTESRLVGMPEQQSEQLRTTVTREVERLATITASDVVAVLDAGGRIFARAGAAATKWPIGVHVDAGTPGPGSAPPSVAVLPSGAFRVSSARLRFDSRDVGALVTATSLDGQYARDLATLAGAAIVITINDTVVGSTLPEAVTLALTGSGELGPLRTLDGDEYAIQTLVASGPARIYMLTSIDAASRVATREALMALGLIALWAFVLAAVASLWLARTLTDPINLVAGTIATMTAARDFSRRLEPTRTSRELDALTESFNHLMGGLTAAEAETRAAYLGTIRALAAALDARDPYTAGHSERVSATAVAIARQMGLREADVAVIRLGALLHDIGKIGLADDILQKTTPLTAEEFEQIKRHPGLGARILRQVSFLEPHLPIVELHHERPDGDGYPFGLRGENIPLAARIVHVADAFDAITSARAYRPARPADMALEEIRRHTGTQFDPASVTALCDAQKASPLATEPQELLRARA